MYWGNKKVIAVGGGKGGVGKSLISANLAVLLGRMQKRVLLVDADLGAANIHTMIGIRYPEFTLEDYLAERKKNFKDIILTTKYNGVSLVSGASEILSLLSPTYKERQKIIRNLQKHDSDFIIFDLPAGTNEKAIDLFSISNFGILVIEAVPTSLENAFAFLKNMLLRDLLRKLYKKPEIKKLVEEMSDPRSQKCSTRFYDIISEIEKKYPDETKNLKDQYGNETIYLIANSIQNQQQEMVSEKFSKVIKEYLNINCITLGSLPFEPKMEECIVSMTPIVDKIPDTNFEKNLTAIISHTFIS